jgi:hypothetical protein
MTNAEQDVVCAGQASRTVGSTGASRPMVGKNCEISAESVSVVARFLMDTYDEIPSCAERLALEVLRDALGVTFPRRAL